MVSRRTLAALLLPAFLGLSATAGADAVIYTLPGEREFSMSDYVSGGMVLASAQNAKRQAADQYLAACRDWRESLTARLTGKLVGADCGVRVDSEIPAPDDLGVPSVVYSSFSRARIAVVVPEGSRVMVRTEEVRSPEELRCPASDDLCLEKARVLARVAYDARCVDWKVEKGALASSRFIHAACAFDSPPRFDVREEFDPASRIRWSLVAVSSKGMIAQLFTGRDPLIIKDPPPQINILNLVNPVRNFGRW